MDDLCALIAYDPATGFFRRLDGCRNKTQPEWYGGMWNRNYLTLKILGKTYQAHRVAWALFYGSWPIMQIDHINRIKSDNRIANLRLATGRQNNINSDMHLNNTSGFRGVVRAGTKWQAQTKMGNRALYLGRYETKEEASAAYCAAIKKLDGEFFPETKS